MTCPRDKALTLATVLLTEDHFSVEALEAHAKGRQWFRPDYDRELVEVEVHLAKIADEACTAWMSCRFAGLTHLAELCEKIDLRIRRACSVGPKDARECVAELSRLTTAGREALDVAEAIAV